MLFHLGNVDIDAPIISPIYNIVMNRKVNNILLEYLGNLLETSTILVRRAISDVFRYISERAIDE